ncbi:phosphate ABC transporter permease subunit PstC [Allonocardiopsis opalescens]|uniref:Phosphate transport system permease protein n=1 Tax=Allonocardiopsis opalescens TaxID=1144618 RepID=A0A2T0PS64_9ACTN|nr:phosphate ABC transporter permease subunit PstC [Allonocardiopsis opalescens]PRX91737.1 phosphate ABC transporter membrane protein 1 (PhoT family) [Allonocardiopsis opalescens]
MAATVTAPLPPEDGGGPGGPDDPGGTVQPPPAEGEDAPRRVKASIGPDDHVFRLLARAGGFTVLAVMSLVGVFLTYQAWQALQVAGWSFFTTSEWNPDSGVFGIAAVLTGTVLIALVAVVIAVPLAVGTALYISEYAPRGLRRTLVSLVDLMAAVPSVVYGIWGLFLLQPELLVVGPQGDGLPRWLATYAGWIPIFRVDGFDPRDPIAAGTALTSSTFIAGIVVAMMVTPIACSVMREVFSQAPAGEREGAYALGATKWGMIRTVVLPFGTGGIIGGTMLGLGRALGETIGVYLIISPVFEIQTHILENGANSVSALIALRYGEASPFAISALMAAGLALFLMTLAVNFVASSIIARSRSGAASDA